MSESITIELHNRQQAWVALMAQLFPFLEKVLQGGGRWVLTVSRRKRTRRQNRRYWGRGVLSQISEQVVVNGKMYETEVWHEQFKRMFIGVIELPNGQVVGMSSADLDTREFCDFCDQVEAYAATELGVRFVDLEPHNTPAPERRESEAVPA